MKQIWLITLSEWGYWLRSHLALGSVLIFLLLSIVTSVLSASRMDAERHLRTHQQTEAEETFLAQPDRHPHRMVHYGHYLFRTPAPLALFDPGLDTVTGQSIFLEGHRQNTVMFSESASSANLGGFSWLSPAMVYQLFAPLVIILLGYGSISREREAAVLTPLLALGITGHTLIAGKALALLSFTLILLFPLIVSSTFALQAGESITTLVSIFSFYFVYLSIWVGLILVLSTLLQKRSVVLATSTGLWFILSLVLPSIAVNIATGNELATGKIQTDLAMLSDIRKLGNSHNANDPVFQELRVNTLKQYNVERIEDLPVNYRGIVAIEGEKKLTELLNRYMDERMLSEKRQDNFISSFGWFTPSLAISFASRAIAGTDLENYHRFQKEAEAVRFNFVQGLNHAHAEKLSYQADINRNKDDAAFKRARVDASNWQVLQSFNFQTAPLSHRINNASSQIGMLLLWLFAAFGLLLWCGGKIKP